VDILITGRGTKIDSALKAYIRGRIYFALSRFANRIGRIRVVVGINIGQLGKVENLCQIRIQIPGKPTVAISCSDSQRNVFSIRTSFEPGMILKILVTGRGSDAIDSTRFFHQQGRLGMHYEATLKTISNNCLDLEVEKHRGKRIDLIKGWRAEEGPYWGHQCYITIPFFGWIPECELEDMIEISGIDLEKERNCVQNRYDHPPTHHHQIHVQRRIK